MGGDIDLSHFSKIEFLNLKSYDFGKSFLDKNIFIWEG
ncbi:hypothetical protein FM120_07145 [Sphingobacterium faecium PCAi_F2.5]|nr:hypothetical protein FM120_07145 [Sphingobacterium faecium PCAi_F2.5]